MDPKILDALIPLVEVLEKLEIPYQIGGSLASSLHGAPRSSLDVDLLVSIKLDQAEPLVQELAEDFYISAATVVDAVERGTSFNVIHLPTTLKLDLFICGTNRFRAQSLARRRQEALTLGDGQRTIRLYVTSAEDIVLHKLDWFRKGGETSERQWQDVLGVLKVQGGGLDVAHMKKWAAELQVADLLERALLEAGLGKEAS